MRQIRFLLLHHPSVLGAARDDEGDGLAHRHELALPQVGQHLGIAVRSGFLHGSKVVLRRIDD